MYYLSVINLGVCTYINIHLQIAKIFILSLLETVHDTITLCKKRYEAGMKIITGKAGNFLSHFSLVMLISKFIQDRSTTENNIFAQKFLKHSTHF